MSIIYFLVFFGISIGVIYGFHKAKHLYKGLVIGAIIFISSIIAYKAFLEQILAKSYGGNYTVVVPEGMRFYGITWKDSDLWIGWYNPKEKECVFKEDSKFNILQGKITINNCNPIALTEKDKVVR